MSVVQPASIEFVSDGIATSLVFDVSLLPLNFDIRGNVPSGILLPVVQSTFTGVLTGVTASIANGLVTLTFTSAPPQLDGSGNLVIYTATFLLQLPE